jgi:type I restriction enzyme S subunit
MKKVKLGDVCKIQSGGTPSRGNLNYWNNGNIPWVKISDIKEKHLSRTEEFITQEGLANSSAKIFPKETILYTIFATLGEVSILEIDATTNQAIAGLQIIDENICKDYLYYYLISLKPFVNEIGRGVAQNNINMQILRNFEIPLPSLEEQKAIARKLDKVSGLIEKRKTQHAKLSELVKSRFIEMFGNMTHNTHGWDTLLLDECFEITSSKRILKSEWKDKGIPFLRVRDMVQLATTGKLDNEFFVSEEFYGSLSDSDGVPKQGDILMSATSTLGKCHVVSSGERFYFKDADVLRFRAKKAINPVFFMEQIKTEYIEEQIARTLGITTVAHFTIKAAKTINIRLPNIELQNQFAAFVEQTNKSKYHGEFTYEMEVAA